ncbi:MAG: hypothetical protein HQK79_02850 [Desulfobacterales bacterium]|nr:hypothetical protein [Desulfobacterales bacterium]MBF0396821.1 hypothetical protein [Desulfobacterales bacterium]
MITPQKKFTFTIVFIYSIFYSLLSYPLELADNPMESKVKPAPPLIMFVLDNSGSMDWETLVSGGSGDGTFEGYYYVFDDAGDNAYDDSNILTGTNRKKWKSQWYGVNKMYYNPYSSYDPWPLMSDADTSTPRSNPNNSTPTFTLNNTYMSLESYSGPDYALVDNLDVTPYFMTTGSWSETSHTPEYNGSSFINSSTGAASEARWTPDIPSSGTYEVWVWWVCNSGSSRDNTAQYTVSYNGGTSSFTKDQRSNAGQWNSLGSFNFSEQQGVDSVEIICDNKEACSLCSFSAGGTWSESGGTSEYLNSSYSTNTSGRIYTWTPNVPKSGSYKVYVWWACRTDYDKNAKYTITYDGGSAEIYKNQRQEAGNVCGQWVELGTYNFAEGTAGNIKVERHSGSTSSSYTCADAVKLLRSDISTRQYVKVTRGSTSSSYPTSADAVRFVPSSGAFSTINVKNAHYYLIDDTNSNKSWDSGENIYLVNFDSGARSYYRIVNVDANGRVSGEIRNISALPDALRPKLYDDSGNLLGYKTDGQDLQNFANWYSFYRRRELTGKAAVSKAINDLSGVSVGYYSINSGLRQTLQPVRLDSNALISDNKDSTFTSSGTWSESGSPNEYSSSSYTTTSSGNWGKWTPNISEGGDYKVYAWWNCYNNRDQYAKYTISYNGGTATVNKNQRQQTGNVCGNWVLIGTYNFSAGTTGYVKVERHSGSNGDSTCADAVKFEPVDGSVNVDKSTELLNQLYAMDSNGGTPLRTGLYSVGQYFDNEDSGATGGLGSSPFASQADGGACQQVFDIVISDGYWNDSFSSAGNQDGDQGAPYADSYSNTLADVAMKFYKQDLHSGLTNEVPTNSCDRASRQHLVTYSVSFGTKGSLTPGPEGYEDCLASSSSYPTWQDPEAGSNDPGKIDDMWHASANGRGKFFSAEDPEQLVDSLTDLMEDIKSRLSSGASVAVNGESLTSTSTLYQAQYNSGDWTGDVIAYPIDQNTGDIQKSETKWKSSDELQSVAWDSRKIVTYNGTNSGAPFRYDNLTAAQKLALDSTWAATNASAVTNVQNIVKYIRGEEISGFRARQKKLGDIVHSSPILVGNTLYAGANDGMLHAFSTVDGKERFAYVPNLVFNNLSALKNTTFSHKFFVDMPVYSRKIDSGGVGTILVGALGKGGKGYYALNITNADSITLTSSDTESQIDDMVLWEYPKYNVTDNDIGYTYSRAFISKSHLSGNQWVVIFGNGYNSTNGYASLYILNATDGSLIKKIDTGAGSDNGLSTPSVVDVDNDGILDYAYAGDLKGNMWKFDLTSSDSNNWVVAYNSSGTPKPLFQATSQSITSKPDVMKHCMRDGYIVVFGTGKFFADSDRSDMSQQTIYGIWDYGDDADNSEYLGTITNRTTGALSSPIGVSLLKQSVVDSRTTSGHDIRTLTAAATDWPTTADSTSSQDPNPSLYAGWFFDFPNTGDWQGERVIKDVMIREGIAYIISFTPNNSPCAGGGNSFVYLMDACTGGRTSTARLDINDDNKVDSNDKITVGTEQLAPTARAFTGMLHVPAIVRLNEPNSDKMRDRLIFSTSSAATVVLDTVAEERGIYYWLERSLEIYNE